MTKATVYLLTFLAVIPLALAGEPSKKGQPGKEDPAATKLLADARANRACWHDFPGFSADIAVNIEGKLFPGKIEVESSGKVRYLGLDKSAEQWARPILNTIVEHRLPGDASDTKPCAFANADEAHPLGQAIQLLGDAMGSVYRIRDKQVTMVDRRLKTRRFTISMQDNILTKEGKYLPAAYSIHYWNLITGDLERAESYFQTWQRLGVFDLPVTARMLTAVKATPKAHPIAGPDTEALSTRSLTLSNHVLHKGKAP